MSFSRHLAVRAGALTLVAAALSACSDSTSTRELTDDELEVVGDAVALEIEGAIAQLTADGAMAVETPLFSRRSRPAQRLGLAGLSLQRATLQVSPQECGVPSQNPPVDTDGDQIPDNLSITFALPACHYAGEGMTMDVTGLLRVSDLVPGTPGMTLNLSMDNFRIAMASDELSFVARRDGSSSVTASQSGLSQTLDWRESITGDGFPGVAVDMDWTATFAAAEGQEITPGNPLPDGVYTPGGTIVFRQGDGAGALAVTALSPLQYSAACAAGVVEGTDESPFTAGSVRVGFAGAEGRGFVTITYSACGVANVVFVAAQQ